MPGPESQEESSYAAEFQALPRASLAGAEPQSKYRQVEQRWKSWTGSPDSRVAATAVADGAPSAPRGSDPSSV